MHQKTSRWLSGQISINNKMQILNLNKENLNSTRNIYFSIYFQILVSQ